MSARRGLPSAVKMRHDVHYVDSLLFKEGEVVGRKIPIKDVRPNPNQPRKRMGDLEPLTQSVREHGILEPILVTKESDGYQIVSGERRYLAAQKAGIEDVPCIVKNLKSQEILEIALVENIQRMDLHPIEESDGLQTLFETYGYTHEQIAAKIGRSRSSVSETLKISSLSKTVRAAVHEAAIKAKSTLIDIAKLDDEQQQLALIARIALGAGRDMVRAATRQKSNRPKPYVFRFKDPKKSYTFQLKFRRSDVSHDELVNTLETILAQLKDDN